MYQNKCLVKLAGLPPGFISGNPMLEMSKGKSFKKEISDPNEDAEKRCYWLPDKSGLAIPSRNILAGLIQAAAGLKVPLNKKLALSPIVAGDVYIADELIPFKNERGEKIKNYEVLITRVAIEKRGILRGRPLIKNWFLDFELSWESQFLGKDFHEIILPELLKTLGERIGLGEWRPARKGPYGRFRVLEIKKIE
jgi:hypothetical protein